MVGKRKPSPTNRVPAPKEGRASQGASRKRPAATAGFGPVSEAEFDDVMRQIDAHLDEAEARTNRLYERLA